MTRYSITPLLFILLVIISIHGRGSLAAAGTIGIILFEFWYLYIFIRKAIVHKSFITLLLIAIPVLVYIIAFSFINGLELWVDEIEVIRFARLPLADVARTVMTEHVTVPPLDYWNMWVWNKAAVFFPVHIWEYVYRVPYMMLHSLAAVLLGLVCWGLVKHGSRSRALVAICGFFLYFFSPLLFAYSYEVRFYAMTFLGATVVAALYYKNRLFAVENFPLILLFCLNSVYQFIILVPFILNGAINKSTRKNALVLSGYAALIALIILPFLYVPNPVEAIYANQRIMDGLYGLNAFYFNTPWRQYLVYVFVIVLLLLRRKKALFMLGASIFYVLVVVALNAKYNYRYFGGKHFLFIMPFCTLAVYELFSLSRSLLFRIAAIVLVGIVFIYPFYEHVHRMYTKEFLVAKSPMGLKDVFQYAANNNVARILVEYAATSEEDMKYYQRAISWYSETYSQPKVEEFILTQGCAAFASSSSSLLYSVSGVPPCHFSSNTEIVYLYDMVMITRRN